MTHDAEDPALAWDFLQFAASDQIAVGLAERGMMPARVTEPVRKAVGESATPGSAMEALVKMRFTISPQEIGKERLTGAATMASARVLAGELTVDEALKQYRVQRAREVAGNS